MKESHYFQQIYDLSDKETAIYFALLNLAGAAASTIANKTNIQRTSVYDVLESLMRLGLVSSQHTQGKTIYYATTIDELEQNFDALERAHRHNFEQNKSQLHNLIPALQKLQLPTSVVPIMKTFRGLRGIQQAYELTLKARSEIRAYVDVAAEVKHLPHFFPLYWKRRAAARIPIQSILIPNQTAKERQLYDKGELRQTKLLPKTNIFTAQLKIWDDHILSIAWTEQVAVLMQSRELAQMQKDIFDALWEKL